MDTDVLSTKNVLGVKITIEKVWITKKALTEEGVFSMDNVYLYSKYPNTISKRMIGEGRYVSYYKPDWHLTEEAALAKAREMVKKEIKKLEKKIIMLKGKKY